MKKKYFILSISFALASLFSFGQLKTDTIKVWGVCDMCKSKIEKAASAAGATSANWSDETKLLVVNYDTTKTSNINIQKKVASVGYDTQDIKATDSSFKKLEKCCQYKRPGGNNAKDSTKKDDAKDVQGMNNKCHMDCSACNGSDCCKTRFGKGYYYIGNTCRHAGKTQPTFVIREAENKNCCI